MTEHCAFCDQAVTVESDGTVVDAAGAAGCGASLEKGGNGEHEPGAYIRAEGELLEPGTRAWDESWARIEAAQAGKPGVPGNTTTNVWD